MKNIFSEYGIPLHVHSDSGSQYTSQEFANFAEEYGFKHTTSSPYYHQSNGKAERYVGIVKQLLTKTFEAQATGRLLSCTPKMQGDGRSWKVLHSPEDENLAVTSGKHRKNLLTPSQLPVCCFSRTVLNSLYEINPLDKKTKA